MRTDTIKHYFSSRLSVKATHIVGICFLLSIGVMPLSAQVFSTAQRGMQYDTRNSAQSQLDMQYYGDQVQSNQATQAYSPYQSTVYAPFDNTTPSENTSLYQSPSNSDAGDRSNAPSNRRNLGGVGDPGTQSPESPVGEAWVMLLFAAAAAVVVFVRQRKAAVRG